MDVQYVFLIAAVLLIVSVFSSKLSERFNFPLLVIFLAIGMLAGSEGPGRLYLNDASLVNFLGTVALSFILFSGGLNTRWKSIKPVLWQGVMLSTTGVAITALLVGGFACLVLKFTFKEGLLLGAIVSSTDAAAVFVILRSRRAVLKENMSALLELESGSNDPMAAFLTISLLQLLQNPGLSFWRMIPDFAIQMSCGAAIGILMGKFAIWIFRRLKLDFEGLYPVLSIACVMLTYGLSASLGGNGFLAVYLCGIVMGNGNLFYKNNLFKFHDGLGWLMQITMFLILGLQVFPSELLPVAGSGLLLSVFLIIVARPAAVFLTMARSKLKLQEKIFISWGGLRGAVPIVFATFPMMANYVHARMIFNLVFFIVLTSVVLQGKTLRLVAKWLNLYSGEPPKPRYPLEYEPTEQERESNQSKMREFEISKDSALAGRKISQARMPKGALIVLIRRKEKFLIPNSDIVIAPEDSLLVLAEPEAMNQAESVLSKIIKKTNNNKLNENASA